MIVLYCVIRLFLYGEKGLQLVTLFEIVEKMIKSIPWGHNQRIAYKCKDIDEAIFYVQKTLDNNWSRNVLEHQIDSKLYERQGKAITNFQIVRNMNEKELEDALVNQITQFLLELGTGFSYLGRQVHIKVGDSDFYMDLLFY